MTFKKFAKVPVIAIAEGSFDENLSFNKTASSSNSYYASHSDKLNVRAILEQVAEEYKISADPKDYIYEAARAVTADVPNQNADAFPREELLRFDHRLGKAVYQTFIMKPHQINHRADNPKTARGVVLDASYNDTAEALANCPECKAKTAAVEDRDASGLNCKKCGATVKDEFVELLIAIDTKKDPTFAEGVRNGTLDSLSMGCEASYTDCSICSNRAHTVAQFCSHIKSGNKKKIFKTASGPKMSYEKCGGVMFTEISRVDQPADPTALQREVFDISGLSMQAESEMLIMASKIAKLEQITASGNKDAQLADDIKRSLDELKNTNPEMHTQLVNTLNVDMGVPNDMSIADYAKKLEESENKNVTPDELGIKVDEVGQAPMTQNANKVLDRVAGELGAMMDSIEENNTVSANTFKFADSYKAVEATVTKSGNVKIFTPKGTLFVIRPEVKFADEDTAKKFATEVLASVAHDGIVATVSKYKTVVGPKMAQVLEMHIEDFAGGREEGDKMPAPEGGDDDKQPEVAKAEDSQVGEEHTDRKDEVREQRDQSNSDVLEQHMPDHKEKLDGFVPATKEDHTDMAPKRDSKPKTTLDNIETDMATKKAEKSAEMACMAGEACKDDKCAMHNKKSQEVPAMPAMAAELDTAKTAAVHASRVERLYKSRLEAAAVESAKKLAEVEKSAAAKVQSKLLRALKLASKRQTLNLEASPLKAAMFDALLTEVDVDAESYYPGMDPITASVLVEATTSTGIDAFVESIVKRATEFLAMSDEAFSAIEADVKNLQPAMVSVPVANVRQAASKDALRKQAMAGNLAIAPSATTEIVSDDGKRDNIRSALGSTKVRRASETMSVKK